MRHDGYDGASRLRRGPYGTNEGDIWLLGEYFQKRIQEEKGPGWRMVAEMLRDPETGEVGERLYTTEVPELVKRADAGHVLWVAAQAAKN
jgi:hypothetical protein